ncbi:hypothetical protein Bbelb_018050 [Branchiostoma belcheri]|nr:hypothetical protein Bbelb_018050 [Branchiostoma belcheri]
MAFGKGTEIMGDQLEWIDLGMMTFSQPKKPSMPGNLTTTHQTRSRESTAGTVAQQTTVRSRSGEKSDEGTTRQTRRSRESTAGTVAHQTTLGSQPGEKSGVVTSSQTRSRESTTGTVGQPTTVWSQSGEISDEGTTRQTRSRESTAGTVGQPTTVGSRSGEKSDEGTTKTSKAPYCWLAVKIAFAFVLFLAITWGIVATKLSLLIMIYPLRHVRANTSGSPSCNLTRCYNKTLCRLAKNGTAEYPQDLDCVGVTAIVTLSLAIMVPYAVSFLRSSWMVGFNSREPLPKWHMALVGVVMSIFEVVGICLFVFSVQSSPTLSQSFNVLIMNAAHLLPLAWQFVLQSPRPTGSQAGCLSFSLILLTVAWAPKVKEFEISLEGVPKCPSSGRVLPIGNGDQESRSASSVDPENIDEEKIVVACKSKLQLVLALSTVASSALFVLAVNVRPICRYLSSVIPGLNLCETAGEPWVTVLVVIGMLLTEVVMVICICQSSQQVMEPEAKSTDILDSETRWWERGVKEAIYERMYNPTLNREGGDEKEMSQLIDSIRGIAMSSSREDRRKYESHILFDDGWNDLLRECFKWKTPYGLQLQFDWKAGENGSSTGMKFFIHLKDNELVKNKKRWSQIMYMTYILDFAAKYKPLGMESGAIEDTDITMEPEQAKPGSLRLHAGKPHWTGGNGDNQVISINLKEKMMVTGIVLQASDEDGNTNGRVTRIRIADEEKPVDWHTESKPNATVTCLLEPKELVTLKIEPLDWAGKTKGIPPTLRMEILGYAKEEKEKCRSASILVEIMELLGQIPCAGCWYHVAAGGNLEWGGTAFMEQVSLYRASKARAVGEAKGDVDRDTYILATDADVNFTPTSANLLLDLAQWHEEIGAVCGRTHCMGSGFVYWLQLFDYAVGHWFQKIDNNALADSPVVRSVMTSRAHQKWPKDVTSHRQSVYRCKAVRKCVETYSSKTEQAKDFLMKDMGEDRWLCTLMIEKGWRLVYTSIADDSTFVPETVKEFFNQRRRWGPSTVANQMEMLKKWWNGDIENPSVSSLFMLYQVLLFLSFLIGPATAILIAAGGLDFYVSNNFPIEATITIMSILTFLFGYICLNYKQDTQLKWATALGSMFGVVMIMALIALVEKIVVTIRDFMSSNGIGSSEGFGIQEIFSVADTIYFIATIGMFLVTGLLHPKEFYCLFSGILYFFALPTTFIFLNIYGLCNLTDKSWGTRERTSGDTQASDKNIFDSIGGAESDAGKKNVGDKHDNDAGSNSSKTQPESTDGMKEQPGTGDSVNQRSLLKEMAYLRRLEIIDVEGDGNCFFRAVTEDQTVEMDHRTLRAKAVEYMEQNKAEFSDFHTSSQGNFEHYLSDMKKDGAFVDHPVIQAAANVLNRTIHIIRPDDENFKPIVPKNGSQNHCEIFIGYLPDSKHYVATRALTRMMVTPGDEVRVWLSTVFNETKLMERYAKLFKEHGYIDTSTIAGMKEKDLKDIGIEAELHRNTIMKKVEKLNPVQFHCRIPDNTKDWLTSIGLGQYIEKFEKDGTKERSDLSQLKTINLDKLFERLGIRKKAHIDRLKKSVDSMREQTDEEKLHEEVREIVDFKNQLDMREDKSPLGKKQYNMWEKLQKECLDPNKGDFSSNDEALKAELGKLRDSAIKVLSMVNIFWLVVIVTFTKSKVLRISGQNPLGVTSLFVFGTIQVIQFVAMLLHRAIAFLHWVARVDTNIGTMFQWIRVRTSRCFG